MRENNAIKWMTPLKLIELLSQLPVDSRVTCNSVMNLSVMSSDGSKTIYWIDFMDEVIESME